MSDYTESPSHSWSVTFADLMMLLLTFFVLKLSMLKPPPPPAQSASQTAGITTAGNGFQLTLERCFTEEGELKFDCKTVLLTLARVARGKNLALHAATRTTSWSSAERQTAAVMSQTIGAGLPPEAVSGSADGTLPAENTPALKKNHPSPQILTLSLRTKR